MPHPVGTLPHERHLFLVCSPIMTVADFRYAEKSVPRFLVWYVVGNWIAQWRNDIFVWVRLCTMLRFLIVQENKVYKSKPVLVRGDGPVAKLRRWYSQFYSPTNMNHEEEVAAQGCGGDRADW
jgi:hypothetical protein